MYGRITEGKIKNICKWEDSRIINQGNSVNKLTIVKSGDQIEFFINNHRVYVGTNEILFNTYIGFNVLNSITIKIDNLFLNLDQQKSSNFPSVALNQSQESSTYNYKDETYQGSYLNISLISFPSATLTYWDKKSEYDDHVYLDNANSKVSHNIGGEIDFYAGKLFVRGIYQFGSYMYTNSGTARNYLWAIDIGTVIGNDNSSFNEIPALGYHTVVVKRDNDSTDTGISKLNSSELIFGIISGHP